MDMIIYSDVAGENFDLGLNGGKSGTASASSHGKDPKNSRAILALFVLLLALLLAMVAACVALAVEISKLKSGATSCQPPSSLQQLQNTPDLTESSIQNMTQQLNREFLRSIEQLNFSIAESHQMLSRNYTALDDRVQQLSADLGRRGQYASFPLDSCAALPPSSRSGHYWVRTPTGSAVLVYCDPSRSCGGVTGGWRRVVELDMTNSSQQYPSALRQCNDDNICTCGTDPDVLCTSITFLVNFLSYSKVCGKIRGHQVGSPDSSGVGGSHRSNDIDTNYLDGVSLTHGSPRQHIWSFAAALDEVGTHPSGNCPCINRDQASSTTGPPAFVGNDYFCDTGSSGPFDGQTFHSGDPLWDGAGCGALNDCCTFNNPPWFYKQLPQPTTDSIEMRVCRDQDTDIAIETVEIYVYTMTAWSELVNVKYIPHSLFNTTR